MGDVGRLLAYEDIGQLVGRYVFAMDTRDLDTLVGLFVPDVRVGRHLTGRDALRTSFDSQLREIGRSILNVGTHVIDLVDADHATGWVYTKAEIEADGRWIHQAVLYEDTYERIEHDGWCFVRRIHELWYGAEPGANRSAFRQRTGPNITTVRHGAGTVCDVASLLGLSCRLDQPIRLGEFGGVRR